MALSPRAARQLWLARDAARGASQPAQGGPGRPTSPAAAAARIISGPGATSCGGVAAARTCRRERAAAQAVTSVGDVQVACGDVQAPPSRSRLPLTWGGHGGQREEIVHVPKVIRQERISEQVQEIAPVPMAIQHAPQESAAIVHVPAVIQHERIHQQMGEQAVDHVRVEVQEIVHVPKVFQHERIHQQMGEQSVDHSRVAQVQGIVPVPMVIQHASRCVRAGPSIYKVAGENHYKDPRAGRPQPGAESQPGARRHVVQVMAWSVQGALDCCSSCAEATGRLMVDSGSAPGKNCFPRNAFGLSPCSESSMLYRLWHFFSVQGSLD